MYNVEDKSRGVGNGEIEQVGSRRRILEEEWDEDRGGEGPSGVSVAENWITAGSCRKGMSINRL